MKSKDNFSKQRCKADGLRYHCKECRSRHQQEFYKVNKSKILAKNKQYYSKNRDKILANSSKSWNHRYHNDLNFRLAKILRSRLYCAINNNQKNGSAVDDLGCSIEELKRYLESQFQEDMSWDNYGKWHIDHIKPLCLFNLSDKIELMEACNYNNLQPLWAKDNLQKGKKWIN